VVDTLDPPDECPDARLIRARSPKSTVSSATVSTPSPAATPTVEPTAGALRDGVLLAQRAVARLRATPSLKLEIGGLYAGIGHRLGHNATVVLVTVNIVGHKS
jgi:hypothetical protein